MRLAQILPGCLLLSSAIFARSESFTIATNIFHLRTGTRPEWTEFANLPVHGRELKRTFIAKSNAREQTLLLRQRDVKYDWRVALNGKEIGKLFLMEGALTHALPLAPGALLEGTNELAIIPPKEEEDIFVGEIQILSDPMRIALGESELQVDVTDSGGHPLPCRVTITDHLGTLAAISASPEPGLAIRPGIIYTAAGHAVLGLRAGEYTVLASRGFEYGIAAQKISIRKGETNRIALRIDREVNTTGLVSSDTHVHTFTLSRHGDATLEERMVTLAGEGIELPIATDHNLHADYREAMQRTGTAPFFTPVTGNEVTTAVGHFNIFPVPPDGPVADQRLTQWPDLFKSIHQNPGIQVIVLNHPRDLHVGFRPFAATNLNAATGKLRPEMPVEFNAMELVTSGALQTDYFASFQNWFALLNHGHRLTGVSSSDSHDVSRYIVGQGRTYIQCNDEQPGQINIHDACQNLAQGRAMVSFGLLAKIEAGNGFFTGDLATNLPAAFPVKITAHGPRWVTCERIALYANGALLREKICSAAEMSAQTNRPDLKAEVTWMIDRPRHDVFLVAIATGPGVTDAFWQTPRPYQPTSPDWTPRLIGATNPIWVDADGDNRFTSAFAYATTLKTQYQSRLPQLIDALGSYDEAVATQIAGLYHDAGDPGLEGELRALGTKAAPPVRAGFEMFERLSHP